MYFKFSGLPLQTSLSIFGIRFDFRCPPGLQEIRSPRLFFIPPSHYPGNFRRPVNTNITFKRTLNFKRVINKKP